VTRFGISTALLTPFTEEGLVDWSLLVEHASAVLARGANSVTLFGTTGEGASISRLERLHGIEALLAAEIKPHQIILGVCASSIGDAVEQIDEGYQLGVQLFLLMPPFYFKNCGESGIFEWHTEIFSRTDSQTQFILYNIPQQSGVTLSANLVDRLHAVAPTRIFGVKDSSGSWDSAKAFLAQRKTHVLILEWQICTPSDCNRW